MTTLKKITKVVIKVFACFIILILTYLLAAFILSRIPSKAEKADQQNIVIYILTNGVHTDIVVPVKNSIFDWSEVIPFSNTQTQNSSAQLVAMGWGDKGFYLHTPTWADLKFSVAFKAAFALSSSAIHTTFYNNLTEDEACKRILISEEQYRRLVEFIQKSFITDRNEKPVFIKTEANYGPHDAFYEANGRYNLFYTCNTWSNHALKACGQKASWWTPFDWGIFYHYK